MKSKASLVLIELVIMILIFALAAALCLQAFHWASAESERIILRDDAVLAVQNMAELLKAGKGEAGEGNAASPPEQDYGDRFSLEVTPLDPDTNGLGGAAVSALTPDGEIVFSADVYWQEPLKWEEGGGRSE